MCLYSVCCCDTKIHFFGGNGEEDTPVPIPNTEVKLFSADGTARETGWESRTPPKILFKKPDIILDIGLFAGKTV